MYFILLVLIRPYNITIFFSKCFYKYKINFNKYNINGFIATIFLQIAKANQQVDFYKNIVPSFNHLYQTE